jgi:arginase family enzyme
VQCAWRNPRDHARCVSIPGRAGSPSQRVCFGAFMSQLDASIVTLTFPALQREVAMAERAVNAVARDGARVVVHFDVDAVDPGDLALANFPHYGTGVPLASAGLVLQTLLAASGLAALVLTEINPTHDPDGAQLERYIDTVTSAVTKSLGR